MKFKHRLLVSNVVMVAAPVLATVVVGGVGTVLVWYVLFGTVLGGDASEAQVVALLSEAQVGLSTTQVKSILAALAAAVIAAVLVSTYFTERFLTRFLVQRIEEPLAELERGLRTLAEGDLSYRIRYQRDDEFIRACDDFDTMARRLEESTARLKRQDEVRRRLLADVSHDLRSPLTSIRGYAEGLADGVATTPDQQRRYARTIARKCDEVVGLVNGIFELSKLDLEEYPLSAEPVDLGEAAETAVERFRETEEGRATGKAAIAISVRKPASPVVAEVDPGLLSRSIGNLLENCAKYAAGDGGCAARDGVRALGRVVGGPARRRRRAGRFRRRSWAHLRPALSGGRVPLAGGRRRGGQRDRAVVRAPRCGTDGGRGKRGCGFAARSCDRAALPACGLRRHGRLAGCC